MNLQNIRAGLANAIQNVNNLRVYEYIPSSVQPPAALISLGSGLYDQDFNDGARINYMIMCLLTRADDWHAQDRLDEFLSQGNDSFFHVIDADPTLGGACDSCRVIGWNDAATYTIGGIDYLGVEVNVEVVA